MNRPVSKETKWYFAVSLTVTLITNRLVFMLPRLVNRGFYHWNLVTPYDAYVPALPWTILIYFGCFGWWYYIYWLVACRDRREADRFYCANALSKIICMLIFILFPTTMTRATLSGDGFWEKALAFLYRIDEADGLFPSVHCLLAWFCWIGIRGKKDVPFAIRFASFLCALAVFASTLTTKQHVLPDLGGGLLLAELSYRLADIPALRDRYGRFADRTVDLLTKKTENKPGL